MANPFTIKLFMPSGNANELKLIEKMNWTGLGMEISRSAWPAYRKRKELTQAGIYILAGYHGDVAKHPHACGENGQAGFGTVKTLETPPRSWGKSS